MMLDIDNETDMTTAIELALEAADDKAVAEGFARSIRGTRSYLDAGHGTGNAGLVVCMLDGSEYQVTVVQSRAAGQ